MAPRGPSTVLDDDLLRLRLLLVVFLLAQVFLGAYLWHIQVSGSDRYEVDLTKQSVRRIRIPGVRGAMVDRHGVILADNRPSHGVALYMEELRKPGSWSNTVNHVESVIARLSGILGRPPEISREDVWMHIRRRLPLPLIAWRELDDASLARFVESGSAMPGVDIYTQPVRVYPQGRLACHTIGYVGRADPPKEEEEESFHYYLPEMAGRSGLESSLDRLLRGDAGGRLMRVDVSGYRRQDLSIRTPQRGRDVMLALDAELQRLVERALGAQEGSAVVMDPRNGDVLAIASNPGYDLNKFIPFISSADWKILMDDTNKPLMHKAVAGAYAPGSTFKMVTALAGLSTQRSNIEDVHNCPGYFQLGNATFRCWNRTGHGPVNLEQAIEGSCNVYFNYMGLEAGINAIHDQAVALGLGVRTGIELDAEQPGLVPDPAWKRKNYRDAWRDGDTCNISIGQGALLVTPLQMAVMTSALANRGTVYKPRLIIGIKPEGGDAYATVPPVVQRQINWERKHIELVRLGMKDVVMSPRGTARTAQVPDVVIAGKTGTAEFGRKDEKRRHAWMVAFAPYDQPEYAIVVLVDEGVSGGETAAPVMRQILTGIFKPELLVWPEDASS